MQGLILAAGRGSRMGDETREQPKCFTQLLGKRLIEWQLDALTTAGVAPVAIVTGYQSQLLEPFADQKFTNERWQSTNMVASLMCAQEWLAQAPTVVSYSDIVYRPDHVTALSQSQGDISITYDRRWLELWQVRLEDPLSDAETFVLDPQGKLLTFGEKAKTLAEIQGQYMGLSKITPKGLTWMRECLDSWPEGTVDRLDFTGFLRRMLQAGYTIEALPVDAGWCEVDSVSDRDHYEAALRSGHFAHDWRS